MKIQILSDLHLEFETIPINASNADVVVLAGDIHVGVNAIQWIAQQMPSKRVIYVLGNHEFYGQTYPKFVDKIKEMAADYQNISILENESIEIDGITFHGTTLWTDFELYGDAVVSGSICQGKMTDYKKIRRLPSYSKIRSKDLAIIHHRSIQWLSTSSE